MQGIYRANIPGEVALVDKKALRIPQGRYRYAVVYINLSGGYL
jgi:hypothetical protein